MTARHPGQACWLAWLAAAAWVGAQPSPSADDVLRLLHAGRYDEAIVVIPGLPMQTRSLGGGSTSVTPVELALLAALLSGSWTPVADLVPEQLAPRDAEAYWYVRGVQAARAAWPGGRGEPLAMARESAERLSSLTAIAGTWSRGEVRRVSILAAIAAAQEERDELTLLLAHADGLESRLREIRQPDDVVLPLDELAGDLWLQIHRYEDARRRYGTVVRRWPERTRAWLGLSRAARDGGASTDARDAAQRVLSNWARSQALAAVESEMRQIVEAR